MMHQLQVFYKKHTDFDFTVAQKSVLDSNNLPNKKKAIFEKMSKASAHTKSTSSLSKREVEVINLLQQNDRTKLKRFDLGEPTSRKEVEILGKWLDQMLNDYVFSKHDLHEDADKQLKAKHLKEILRIKEEGDVASKVGLLNREIEKELRYQIEELTEDLNQAKQEIEKLQEELLKKDNQNKESIAQFKKRENVLQKQFEKLKRRPYDLESSESETSEDKPEPKITRKRTIRKNKKVTRNDMLNLPSSDSENVKRKVSNLHVVSSFEQDEGSDEEQDNMNYLGRPSKDKNKKGSNKSKSHAKNPYKKKAIKRVRTNSFEIDERDQLAKENYRKKQFEKLRHQKHDMSKDSSSFLKESRRMSKPYLHEKMEEAPEITKKKLEDAEYKDLNQRYKQDEGDSNYVLNDEEEIKKEVKKAEDEQIHLNESIDKLEEEQDRVFKVKVSNIAQDLIQQLKILSSTNDLQKIREIEDKMIADIFDSFLENKQELLKKIANKLASARDLDEDYDDDEYEDGDKSSPRMKNRKSSQVSGISKGTVKRMIEDDTDMEDDDDRKSINPMDRDNQEDSDAHIMDQTENYDENEGFVDKSEIMHKKKHKAEKQQKLDKQRGHPKDSESQTTFLMNIQTTADLISYVKRRTKKNVMHSKKRVSRIPTRHQISTTSTHQTPNRFLKQGGFSQMSHMRHFGLIQNNSKSVEIQTEDIDILDLRLAEINLTEIYHFDKISS